jgi:hypothetical protein
MIRTVLRVTVRVTVPLGLLLAAACTGEGSRWSGDWRREIKRADGVTTIRTLGGSIWGGAASLVEELSIGEAEGEEAYLFGQLVQLARHGEFIYVLDGQVPVLRVFDGLGRHVRDIGRAGGGPGEFYYPTGLGIDAGGERLFVQEGGQGRINVFSLAGALLDTWRMRPFNTFDPPFTVDRRGRPFVCTLLNPGAPVLLWNTGMVGWGAEGATGDTLAPPDFDYDAPRLSARGERSESHNPLPFAPLITWAMSPSGVIVAGVPGDYRFGAYGAEGTTRIIEKADWERVPVRPEEARWHRQKITVWNRVVQPDWTWNGPPIPDFKPAYERLVPDRDGRIWVVRPGLGERLPGGAEATSDPEAYFLNPLWRDTPLVDVFRETGEYLGRVDVPGGIKWFLPVPHIEGDIVVAAVEDEQGVLRVKRFRLQVPAG